jgi:hypothetical protein
LDAASPYFRRPEDFRAAILVLRCEVVVSRFRSGWRVLCQRIELSMELLRSFQFALT